MSRNKLDTRSSSDVAWLRGWVAGRDAASDACLRWHQDTITGKHILHQMRSLSTSSLADILSKLEPVVPQDLMTGKQEHKNPDASAWTENLLYFIRHLMDLKRAAETNSESLNDQAAAISDPILKHAAKELSDFENKKARLYYSAIFHLTRLYSLSKYPDSPYGEIEATILPQYANAIPERRLYCNDISPYL